MRPSRIDSLVVAVVLGAPAAPAVEFDVSASGTPVALVAAPLGGGNKDLEVIRDGIRPDRQVGENAGDSALQYDTYDGGNAATEAEDWIGYEFGCALTFVRVVFQEGKHFGNGGWFDPPESLVVQVKDEASGSWATVPGTWDPPYPGRFTGADIVEFETFTWTADAPAPGTGIRIYGRPGGGGPDAFISVAELVAFADVAEPAPAAALAFDRSGGPAPLDVTFDASASKGDGLSFLWDFGDFTTSTDVRPTHTFAAGGRYHVMLTVSSDQGGCTLVSAAAADIYVGDGQAALGRPICSVPNPVGGGNHDIDVIRDGVEPDETFGIDAGSSALQWDTWENAPVATDQWIGYEFDAPRDFATLVFQEGKHFANGGWFDPPESLVVQVKDPATGEWAEAAGSWHPPYPGLLTDGEVICFERFIWTADAPVPGTGIRIYGHPGGGGPDAFISAAELEVCDAVAAPPEAVLTAGPVGGPPPLDVTFDASASKGDGLSFRWDFGDGATSTDPMVVHTYAGAGSFRAKLSVTSDQGGCTLVSDRFVTVTLGSSLAVLGRPIAAVVSPTGGGNHDIEVIRDGIEPATAVGLAAGNSLQQYDTYDGDNAATEDWIGYEFDSPQDFGAVVFQEGNHFDDGGYFDPPASLVVQVKDPATGEWTEASGSWDPPYPGLQTNGQVVDFETFTWTADETVTGTGIRIYGVPGGSAQFISVGELEVYSPAGADVVRSVDKSAFAPGDSVLVSLDIEMSIGDSISIDEVVPARSEVSDISDGGNAADGHIRWDLSGISRSVVTYRLTPPPCGSRPAFGKSTWKAGFSIGTVSGTDELTLGIADRPLGGWTAVDLTAPGSRAQPLAAHDVVVLGTGTGVRASGTKDSFRFVEHPASGDWDIAARIDCFDDPGGKGQAGIMVRETLDDFSAQASICISSTTTAGSAGTLAATFRKATATPAGRNLTVSLSPKDVPAFPIYLRLRRGSSADGKAYVFFERSDDGAKYTAVASKEIGGTGIALPDDVLVGLAVAGTGGGPASATFGDVRGPDFPTGAVPPAPAGLAAAGGPKRVSLTWDPVAGADGYTVYRIDPAASFPAPAPSFTDTGLDDGTGYCYEVTATRAGIEGDRSSRACATTASSPFVFLRGDADGNGAIELTDPIFILGFMFLGSERPPCFNAADADGNGALELTDPISILSFMFLGSEPPPDPGTIRCGPQPGVNPFVPPQYPLCDYPAASCPN